MNRRIAACEAAADGGYALYKHEPSRNAALRAAESEVTLEASPHVPATAGDSSTCAALHASYENYTRGGECPFDRHLIEQIYYTPGCAPPGLRRCQSPHLPPPSREHQLAAKRDGAARDETMRDGAVEWRAFRPLRSFDDTVSASTTGKVPGVFEPPDGQTWAAVEFPPSDARLKWARYVARLLTFIPSLPSLRTAIDIGGGVGHFANVLHATTNVTCVTLTKDNSVGRRWYFDLPFVEMAVAQAPGLALLWSGVQRLPLPDRSVDLIHTRNAVPMTTDLITNEGMLYDWDRLLKPGGYVVLTSDISRYLTGNEGRPDTTFAALLPEMASRLGWQCECPRWGRRGSCGGCQIDDPGKVRSHIWRKPL